VVVVVVSAAWDDIEDAAEEASEEEAAEEEAAEEGSDASDEDIIEDSMEEASDICDDIAEESIIEDDDEVSWANAPVASTAATAVVARSMRIMVVSLSSTLVGSAARRSYLAGSVPRGSRR